MVEADRGIVALVLIRCAYLELVFPCFRRGRGVEEIDCEDLGGCISVGGEC